MIRIDIPGFGLVELKHLVTDFTGTLSEDGGLCEGVRERLSRLSGDVEIHVLTADTFGRAREEFSGINCAVHILEGRRHDQKRKNTLENSAPPGCSPWVTERTTPLCSRRPG
jgi:soluble P-type ATPase